MKPYKNHARDEAVGRAFHVRIRELGLHDGEFAKLVNSSSPTIQTWRKGGLPHASWHPVLLKETGLDYSSPASLEAIAAKAPTEAEVQAAEVAMRKKVASTRAPKLTAAPKAPKAPKVAAAAAAPKTVLRKNAKAGKQVAHTTTPALEYGSFEGLTIAATAVNAALASNRKLDPADANDRRILSLVSVALATEASRREQTDPRYRTEAGLRALVLSHPDPREALRALREHAAVAREVLDAVERNLPAGLAAVA